MLDGFQFPKTMIDWMDAHGGAAGWAQAVIAGAAIIAVYIAATIPVRAEDRRRERERRLRADGLALLLYPEILILKDEIESAILDGDIYDDPIPVPDGLTAQIDNILVLDDAGRNLLQTIGILNGVAARTASFQYIGVDELQRPREELRASGAEIWSKNKTLLVYAVANLEEVDTRLQTFIIEKNRLAHTASPSSLM